MRSLLRLAGLTLLACVALAAPASADSVVYVKDGNVWLTSPDAARQYQVTFDGGYSSPSQADDGTIVALQNKKFVRMNRSGKQLNPPVAGVGTPPVPANDFYGPYEPRVSPDGTKIAYWFGQYTDYYSYGCNCYLYHLESQSTWSYVDRFTDPSADSDFYKGIEQPEWLTNDRILASYPGFWMSGWTWKIGTGHGYTSDSAQWWYQFKDAEGYNFYPTDPALSRDGKRLAMTNGGDPNAKPELLLASVSGPAWVGEPPYENDYMGNSAVQQPELQCSGDLGAAIHNPTWAPDGGALAFGQPDGVHVLTVPGWDCATLTDKLLVPGGDEPAWGPADVDIAQKPAPPAPAPAPGPAPGPGGDGAHTAFSLSGLTLAPSTFRAARRGPSIAAATGTRLAFTVSGPADVTITVARKSGKPVRGTIKTAAKPGANRLRFMGRIARKTLKPGRYVLTVSAVPHGGGTASAAKAAFRIRR